MAEGFREKTYLPLQNYRSKRFFYFEEGESFGSWYGSAVVVQQGQAYAGKGGQLQE